MPKLFRLLFLSLVLSFSLAVELTVTTDTNIYYKNSEGLMVVSGPIELKPDCPLIMAALPSDSKLTGISNFQVTVIGANFSFSTGPSRNSYTFGIVPNPCYPGLTAQPSEIKVVIDPLHPSYYAAVVAKLPSTQDGVRFEVTFDDPILPACSPIAVITDSTNQVIGNAKSSTVNQVVSFSDPFAKDGGIYQMTFSSINTTFCKILYNPSIQTYTFINIVTPVKANQSDPIEGESVSFRFPRLGDLSGCSVAVSLASLVNGALKNVAGMNQTVVNVADTKDGTVTFSSNGLIPGIQYRIVTTTTCPYISFADTTSTTSFTMQFGQLIVDVTALKGKVFILEGSSFLLPVRAASGAASVTGSAINQMTIYNGGVQLSYSSNAQLIVRVSKDLTASGPAGDISLTGTSLNGRLPLLFDYGTLNDTYNLPGVIWQSLGPLSVSLDDSILVSGQSTHIHVDYQLRPTWTSPQCVTLSLTDFGTTFCDGNLLATTAAEGNYFFTATPTSEFIRQKTAQFSLRTYLPRVLNMLDIVYSGSGSALSMVVSFNATTNSSADASFIDRSCQFGIYDGNNRVVKLTGSANGGLWTSTSTSISSLSLTATPWGFRHLCDVYRLDYNFLVTGAVSLITQTGEAFTDGTSFELFHGDKLFNQVTYDTYPNPVLQPPTAGATGSCSLLGPVFSCTFSERGQWGISLDDNSVLNPPTFNVRYPPVLRNTRVNYQPIPFVGQVTTLKLSLFDKLNGSVSTIRSSGELGLRVTFDGQSQDEGQDRTYTYTPDQTGSVAVLVTFQDGPSMSTIFSATLDVIAAPTVKSWIANSLYSSTILLSDPSDLAGKRLNTGFNCQDLFQISDYNGVTLTCSFVDTKSISVQASNYDTSYNYVFQPEMEATGVLLLSKSVYSGNVPFSGRVTLDGSSIKVTSTTTTRPTATASTFCPGNDFVLSGVTSVNSNMPAQVSGRSFRYDNVNGRITLSTNLFSSATGPFDFTVTVSNWFGSSVDIDFTVNVNAPEVTPSLSVEGSGTIIRAYESVRANIRWTPCAPAQSFVRWQLGTDYLFEGQTSVVVDKSVLPQFDATFPSGYTIQLTAHVGTGTSSDDFEESKVLSTDLVVKGSAPFITFDANSQTQTVEYGAMFTVGLNSAEDLDTTEPDTLIYQWTCTNNQKDCSLPADSLQPGQSLTFNTIPSGDYTFTLTVKGIAGIPATYVAVVSVTSSEDAEPPIVSISLKDTSLPIYNEERSVSWISTVKVTAPNVRITLLWSMSPRSDGGSRDIDLYGNSLEGPSKPTLVILPTALKTCSTYFVTLSVTQVGKLTRSASATGNFTTFCPPVGGSVSLSKGSGDVVSERVTGPSSTYQFVTDTPVGYGPFTYSWFYSTVGNPQPKPIGTTNIPLVVASFVTVRGDQTITVSVIITDRYGDTSPVYKVTNVFQPYEFSDAAAAFDDNVKAGELLTTVDGAILGIQNALTTIFSSNSGGYTLSSSERLPLQAKAITLVQNTLNKGVLTPLQTTAAVSILSQLNDGSTSGNFANVLTLYKNILSQPLPSSTSSSQQLNQAITNFISDLMTTVTTPATSVSGRKRALNGNTQSLYDAANQGLDKMLENRGCLEPAAVSKSSSGLRLSGQVILTSGFDGSYRWDTTFGETAVTRISGITDRTVCYTVRQISWPSDPTTSSDKAPGSAVLSVQVTPKIPDKATVELVVSATDDTLSACAYRQNPSDAWTQDESCSSFFNGYKTTHLTEFTNQQQIAQPTLTEERSRTTSDASPQVVGIVIGVLVAIVVVIVLVIVVACLVKRKNRMRAQNGTSAEMVVMAH